MHILTPRQLARMNRKCAGCGVTLTHGLRERNPKKWCSEACRVRTHRARKNSS